MYLNFTATLQKMVHTIYFYKKVHKKFMIYLVQCVTMQIKL